MTERRPTPKGPVTTTRHDESHLDPDEERILRMRHGWTTPDDMPLPKKSEGNADLERRLLEMERRAFEASGRLAHLRAEAASEEAREATKDKIVDALSDDNSES